MHLLPNSLSNFRQRKNYNYSALHSSPKEISLLNGSTPKTCPNFTDVYHHRTGSLVRFSISSGSDITHFGKQWVKMSSEGQKKICLEKERSREQSKAPLQYMGQNMQIPRHLGYKSQVISQFLLRG